MAGGLVLDSPGLRVEEFAELEWCVSMARTPRVRSLLGFAEGEIFLPDGKYRGMRYKVSRQPAHGLYLRECGSGQWPEMQLVGPTQSGKTLVGSMIPLAYHLFEMKETSVFAVPDGNMVNDKWRVDLRPVIMKTRYQEAMPTTGSGSRDGSVQDLVQFGNGAALRFMTGGGSDQSRAGFTTRVMVVTEMIAFGGGAETSAEGSKLAQLLGRLKSDPGNRRVYLECTVQTTEDVVWQGYLSGTQSRCAYPCHACGEYVTLKRENLVLWEDAASVREARRLARFCCPQCGVIWNDRQRNASLARMVLVHEGQTVDAGGVVRGPVPDVERFTFHYTGAENLFFTIGDLAVEEWNARRAADQELAERAVSQFVWAKPVPPNSESLVRLDMAQISRRVGTDGRGVVPVDTVDLVATLDLGKYMAHWGVFALGSGGQTHTVDYGMIQVHSDELGIPAAVKVALGRFSEICDEGWGFEGGKAHPSIRWVDSGWQTPVVYEFCKAQGGRYWPIKGMGASQDNANKYLHPKQQNKVVPFIGSEYHVALLEEAGLYLVHVNADAWKSTLWTALSMPVGELGAHVLFAAQEKVHWTYARHLLAERRDSVYVPEKGITDKWIRVNKENHYLDVSYLGLCALDFARVRREAALQGAAGGGVGRKRGARVGVGRR